MNTKNFTRIAMIAAIYTAICFVPGLSMIAFGQIQVRIAEALTLLPLLDKRAIAGVTLGCFLTNLLGAMLGLNPTGFIDAIVGTLATFLAAVCTYRLRNVKTAGIPVLSCLMPVIFNFFIVIPQLVAVSVLGVVLSALFDGQPMRVLMLGGACFMVSGLCALMVRRPLGERAAVAAGAR